MSDEETPTVKSVTAIKGNDNRADAQQEANERQSKYIHDRVSDEAPQYDGLNIDKLANARRDVEENYFQKNHMLQPIVDEAAPVSEEAFEGLTVEKIEAAKESMAQRHTRLTGTHTVVELEVSRETYAEVRYLLEQAGYDHCIGDNGAIDLSGIALTKKPEPKKPTHFGIVVNGKGVNAKVDENGMISYENIRDIAELSGNPSCAWHSEDGAHGGRGGILSPGRSVQVEQGMHFTIVHTGNA